LFGVHDIAPGRKSEEVKIRGVGQSAGCREAFAMMAEGIKISIMPGPCASGYEKRADQQAIDRCRSAEPRDERTDNLFEIEVEGIVSGFDFNFGFGVAAPAFGDCDTFGRLVAGGPLEADSAFPDRGTFLADASEDDGVVALSISLTNAGLAFFGSEDDGETFNGFALNFDISVDSSQRGSIAFATSGEGDEDRTGEKRGDLDRSSHLENTFIYRTEMNGSGTVRE